MLEVWKFLRQKRKMRKSYDSQGDVRDHDTWKVVKNGLYVKIAGLGRSNFDSWRKIQGECLEVLVSVAILGRLQTKYLTFGLCMLDKLHGTVVKSQLKVFQASMCSYPVNKRENLQSTTTKCQIPIRCLTYLHQWWSEDKEVEPLT